MSVRRLLLPSTNPYRALVGHIAELTHDHSTLVLEARLSAQVLREKVAAAGGDISHLHIVDATGTNELSQGELEEVTSIPGSHLLELIALRAKKLAMHKAERKVAVVADDALSFAAANSEDDLVAIVTHSLTLHVEGNLLEFAIHPNVSESLKTRMAAIVPDDFQLEP